VLSNSEGKAVWELAGGGVCDCWVDLPRQNFKFDIIWIPTHDEERWMRETRTAINGLAASIREDPSAYTLLRR
jgi:hypothetical protein